MSVNSDPTPTPEQYFTFDTQTQTITDYDIAGGTDVVIPATIGGVPVLHIGPTAFFAKGLTSAVIPEGVLTIEDGYVDREDIGSSYGAFGLNFGTEENPFSITFPGSLTYIGVGACAVTTLTSVSTGDGVTEIADFAFAECNWLESLALGRSVERIGFGAFVRCALTEFTAPDSLRFIGEGAFVGNYISYAILPANVNVGEGWDTLGDYELRDFYYTNNRQAGEYTYDEQAEVWSFEASDPFAGGSEAKIRVTPSGGGRKIMYGGGELIVKISAAGAGKKKMFGGSETRITASTTGGGKKKMVGGGEARIIVHPTGTGGRLFKGGGEARIIRVSAEGGGTDFYLPLEITPDHRYSYELAEADITITGIAFRTVIPGEDGADDQEVDYLAGTDDYALTIEENPLLQDNFENVLSAIYQKIGGFTYRPYSFEILGYPHVWPGDRITKIIDADGAEHHSIITNHIYKLNGKSSIEARGETETVRGYATGAPFTPKQRRVLQSVANIEAARQTSNLEQAVLRLNELVTNSLGFYDTVITEENGVKTVYIHDKPTLEESMIIWTMTEQGLAWTEEGWNEGSPVWQYGVMADGSIVAKLLDVIGIRAEWIEVGTAGDYIEGEISDARDYARDLLNSLADGTYTGGTFIDGTTLYSPNIIGLNILGMSGEFDWLRAGKTGGAHVEIGAQDSLPFISMHDDAGNVITALTKQGIMIDPRGKINLPYLVSSNPDNAVIRTVNTVDRRYLMLRSGEGEENGAMIYVYNENDPTYPGQLRLYSGGSISAILRADNSARFYGDLQVDGLLSTAAFRANTAGNLLVDGNLYSYGETVLDGELRMRGNRPIRFPYYGYDQTPAGVLRVVGTAGRRYMIWNSHADGSGARILLYSNSDSGSPGHIRLYPGDGESLGLLLDSDLSARFYGDLRYDGGLYRGSTRGVPRADVRTGTSSASGSIAAKGSASIAMADYSFFPNIYSEAAVVLSVNAQTSASTGTTGRFLLRNEGTVSYNYVVRWRYITT